MPKPAPHCNIGEVRVGPAKRVPCPSACTAITAGRTGGGGGGGRWMAVTQDKASNVLATWHVLRLIGPAGPTGLSVVARMRYCAPSHVSLPARRHTLTRHLTSPATSPATSDPTKRPPRPQTMSSALPAHARLATQPPSATLLPQRQTTAGPPHHTNTPRKLHDWHTGRRA